MIEAGPTEQCVSATNDDGIHAPGFAVLEDIARELSDDVWVCAPAEEQSGAGHSLTLNHPVRLRETGERRYAVTGTPTDSVMLGLRTVLKDKQPDLILSGVNRGANLGDDHYSGTASAAMEGTGRHPVGMLSQCLIRDGAHEPGGRRSRRGQPSASTSNLATGRSSTSTSRCPPTCEFAPAGVRLFAEAQKAPIRAD